MQPPKISQPFLPHDLYERPSPGMGELSKEISIHLPKRDELSFITVLALPNASKMGLDCMSLDSMESAASWSAVLLPPPAAAAIAPAASPFRTR